MSGTMDGALQKATRLELVEVAQRRLHKEKAEALAVGQQEDALEPTESNVMTVSRSTN